MGGGRKGFKRDHGQKAQYLRQQERQQAIEGTGIMEDRI